MNDARCGLCGGELIDGLTADNNDPRINCGGDCWGCIREIEAEVESVAARGREIDRLRGELKAANALKLDAQQAGARLLVENLRLAGAYVELRDRCPSKALMHDLERAMYTKAIATSGKERIIDDH